MAGLTSTGLSIKRLQDIRDEVTGRLESFFGDDINTAEDSVFGQLRDSVVPGESSIWEQLQIIYDSQFPSRAEGQQLDDNVGIVGAVRKGDVKSTVTVSVTGDNTTVVPSGFTVAVSTTKDEFDVVAAGSLSNTATVETLISIDVVTNSIAYTVTIDAVPSVFNSDASATQAEIVAGLIAAIPIAVTSVTAVATANPNEILITSTDNTVAKNVTLDANMSFKKVTSLIKMQSKVAGVIVGPINLMTVIKTPISGIDSSTNKVAALLGRLKETDSQLRERRDVELAVQGSSSVNAIFSRISEVVGVRSAVVLENFTNSIDGNGLEPHSIQAIVDGGTDKLIAKAIFDTKPVGTDMNGAESVAVIDSMDVSRNILFDRPTLVPIFIEITLTKFTDYPSDGDTQIKDALVKFGTDNQFAGDDVITSRLYTPINSVQGQQVDSLFIGTSANPTLSTPIVISLTQLAQISSVNITII